MGKTRDEPSHDAAERPALRQHFANMPNVRATCQERAQGTGGNRAGVAVYNIDALSADEAARRTAAIGCWKSRRRSIGDLSSCRFPITPRFNKRARIPRLRSSAARAPFAGRATIGVTPLAFNAVAASRRHRSAPANPCPAFTKRTLAEYSRCVSRFCIAGSFYLPPVRLRSSSGGDRSTPNRADPANFDRDSRSRTPSSINLTAPSIKPK